MPWRAGWEVDGEFPEAAGRVAGSVALNGLIEASVKLTEQRAKSPLSDQGDRSIHGLTDKKSN
jgi:hypothetical protein